MSEVHNIFIPVDASVHCTGTGAIWPSASGHRVTSVGHRYLPSHVFNLLPGINSSPIPTYVLHTHAHVIAVTLHAIFILLGNLVPPGFYLYFQIWKVRHVYTRTFSTVRLGVEARQTILAGELGLE